MSAFDRYAKQLTKAGFTSGSSKARDWLRDNLTKARPNRVALIEKGKNAAKPQIGKMYMYFYDPKHKDTMPYYDAFPLILMIGPAKGGWHGLNLHYLDPATRAWFFDQLEGISKNKRLDDDAKIKLSYAQLMNSKKLKVAAVAFKHYLSSHVQSSIVEVPAKDWDIALMLPTAQWKNTTARAVYRGRK